MACRLSLLMTWCRPSSNRPPSAWYPTSRQSRSLRADSSLLAVIDGLMVVRATERRRRIAVAILIAGLTLWAAHGTSFNPVRLVAGIPQIGDLLGRMFPPDLPVLARIGGPLLQTMEMALLGTTFGMVLAIPFAF